jgi:hypothetical protein
VALFALDGVLLSGREKIPELFFVTPSQTTRLARHVGVSLN